MIPRSGTSQPLQSNLGQTVHTGRQQGALLRFGVAGGRTAVLHQHVPYPFHITRPFHLDPARPELATLYLQSASGGLYAGDDLSLVLHVGQGAAAHVTTQSATIVHACHDATARLAVAATVEPGGFLALLPDPLVLFPAADIATVTQLTVHQGARVIFSDAASLHDPHGANRPFRRFHGAITVRDHAGNIRVSERGGIDGEALGAPASSDRGGPGGYCWFWHQRRCSPTRRRWRQQPRPPVASRRPLSHPMPWG